MASMSTRRRPSGHLAQGLGEIRRPVAVAPGDRQFDAGPATPTEGCLQRAVLRVDRSDPAEEAVGVPTSSRRSRGFRAPW